MTTEERIKRRQELLNTARTRRTQTLRTQIMACSPYSPTINTFIRNLHELKIYTQAQLTEEQINRPCLIAPILLDAVYTRTGETNKERMKAGEPPCATDGITLYHLHHIGQKATSPFAELLENIHNAPGVNKVLHNRKIESWRKDPSLSAHFAAEKSVHWKMRYNMWERTYGKKE